MKTKTIIAFYLILFLIGMALAGLPQGIDNSGGYITGTSTSYVKFSGSSDITLKSTTADRTTFGHVAVDLAGAGTYKITIPDDSYITIDGNLSLSDTMLLKASSSGMASLVTNGTVSGSYAAVEQHLDTDRWHMVSSPVSAATANVYAGIYLMKWGEADSSWTFITAPGDPLNVAQGYFAWSSTTIGSPTDVEFTGLLNTGDKTASGLSYTTGAAKGNGWNLVGNPYSSPLEWNSSWTKSNIDATVYIYDGTNYKTWNYNLGGFGSMGNGYIPSTQSFWVKANASSPSLTVPNSERIHVSQSFYKGSENTIENIFSINVTGNDYSDMLMLGMHAEASDLYDGQYDAYKLFGIEEAPQLYTMHNAEIFSVDIFGPIKEKKAIELGFKTGVDGSFILNFKELENFDKNYSVYLHDKISTSPNKKLIDVRKNPEYKFFAAKDGNENRFTLYFNKKADNNSYTIPGKSNLSTLNIYSYNKDVFVNYTSEMAGEAIIYDLMGREVLRENLEINSLNQLQVNADRGYYIVKVTSNSTTTSQKVFID